MFPIIEQLCFQKSYNLDYFCVRIIYTSRFLSMPVSFATLGGHNMKSKINLLLPFSLNSRSFATTSHAFFATSLSPYPIICLSYSTGYYFTFSHNRLAKPTFKEAGEGGGGLGGGVKVRKNGRT